MKKAIEKEKTEKKKTQTLIVKVEVNDEIEAYKIVSELGFEFDVKSAELGEHKENFNKTNTPFHFLKNNQNNKKKFRDIKGERNK